MKKAGCSTWNALWVSAVLAVLWLVREASTTGGVVTVEMLLTAATSLAIWALAGAVLIAIVNRLRRT